MTRSQLAATVHFLKDWAGRQSPKTWMPKLHRSGEDDWDWEGEIAVIDSESNETTVLKVEDENFLEEDALALCDMLNHLPFLLEATIGYLKGEPAKHD